MALVHSYALTAREGRGDEMQSAFEALAEATKSIAGSQGAMVLRDRKDPLKFLFLEFWIDEASRNAAGPQLPKDVMGRLMAAVSGPLQMSGWNRVAG